MSSNPLLSSFQSPKVKNKFKCEICLKLFSTNGNLKNLKSIDSLIFKGDFDNLNIISINISKSVSLIGENSSIFNIPFLISSKNIRIENLKITLDNSNDAFRFNNAQKRYNL